MGVFNPSVNTMSPFVSIKVVGDSLGLSMIREIAP
jgi:hypothetical protein